MTVTVLLAALILVTAQVDGRVVALCVVEPVQGEVLVEVVVDAMEIPRSLGVNADVIVLQCVGITGEKPVGLAHRIAVSNALTLASAPHQRDM